MIDGFGMSADQVIVLLASREEPPQWQGFKPFIIELSSGEMIDLCQSGILSNVVASDDGLFIAYKSPDTINEIRVLELATGNYTDIVSGSNIIIPLGDRFFTDQ